MALHSYASLSVAGSELTGDVSVSQLGGVDVSSGHIELFEVHFGTRIGTEGQAHRAASRRTILPVRLVKRLDQTTPRLYQALKQNVRVDGDVKMFDNDPDTGETRHRFTLRISQARITLVETWTPNPFDADQSNRPPHELVEMVPHTIAYVDEVHSVEFEDEWSTH